MHFFGANFLRTAPQEKISMGDMDPVGLLEEVNPEIEHLVREALQSQGDLREYSKNIEKELREVILLCIL